MTKHTLWQKKKENKFVTYKYNYYSTKHNKEGFLMNNLDIQKKAVKSFYTDEYKSFALLYDGSLYAWGQNSSGQLGLGDKIDRNKPEKVIFDN